MSESSLKNTWWSSWFILELGSFSTVGSGVGVGALGGVGCFCTNVGSFIVVAELEKKSSHDRASCPAENGASTELRPELLLPSFGMNSLLAGSSVEALRLLRG